MIARTAKQLVDGSDEVTDESGMPLRAYVAMLLIPCLLLCMITSLKYLAPFSIVADIIICRRAEFLTILFHIIVCLFTYPLIFFFLVTVAGATVYYAIQHSTKSPFEFEAFKTASGLFEFMGVCVFSMEGVGVTLAIENNMEEPKKINLVLAGGENDENIFI